MDRQRNWGPREVRLPADPPSASCSASQHGGSVRSVQAQRAPPGDRTHPGSVMSGGRFPLCRGDRRVLQVTWSLL